MTDIQPGYKQTEVGVIPEDWSLKPLDEVVTFLDGKRRPVKDVDRAKMRGSIPYYGASGIVDYVNDYLFDDELILLGEDGENILSRSCRLAFRISGKAWVNNHAHVMKPNQNISIGFLTDYLESLNYESLNSGTAQPKLNKQSCSSILVALPPTKDEQEVIAEALSDTDALIESLERLIAKKRHIKQGAMQQLLTGKKRLPGFQEKSGYKQTELGMIPEDWETTELNEKAKVIDSLHQTPGFSADGYPMVRVTDIKPGNLNLTAALNVSEPVFLNFTKNYKPKRGDIVLSRVGSYGVSSFVNTDELFCMGQNTVVIDCKIPSRFIYFALNSSNIRKQIEDVSFGSGYKSLSLKNIKGLRIPLPSTKAEQTAIATILSDMDIEITALETQLTKTRSIKQGMMHNLLTGKIRLL